MPSSDNYNFTDQGEPREIPAPKKMLNLIFSLSLLVIIFNLLLCATVAYLALAGIFDWWPVNLLFLPF